MTETKQPNQIGPKTKRVVQEDVDLPNAVNDPQVMMRLRKKRHLSGLMCPTMGVMPEPYLPSGSNKD